MGRKFHLKLRTAILMRLVPAIVVLTAIAAVILYGRLYRAIILGFERKLFVTSTVTAQAINGDTHREMMEKKGITSIALDPASGRIYGLDPGRRSVFAVDPQTGAASKICGLTQSEPTGLCWDPIKHRLFLFDARQRLLVRLDPSSGKQSVVGAVNAPVSLLTADPVTGKLLGAGKNLVRIDPDTAASALVASLKSPSLTGLCFGGRSNRLWGLTKANDELLLLNPANGSVLARHRIGFRRETNSLSKILVTDAGQKRNEGAPRLEGLVYDSRKGSFLSVSDRLVPIRVPGFQACLNCYVEGFWNNDSPFYLRKVAAMRRASRHEHLTYLYTQVLLGGPNIMYGLDATVGADHTPIGTRDVLPAQNFYALYDRTMKGKVYITPIERWQNWGLIKSCFAPIFDSKSNVVAMAGTDLDITVIRKRTELALLDVSAVLVGSLVLFGLIALYLGRAITEPTRKITAASLSMAAGRFGDEIEVSGPFEIEELAKRFNRIGAAILGELGRFGRQERAYGRRQVLKALVQEIEVDWVSSASERRFDLEWITTEAAFPPRYRGRKAFAGKYLAWVLRAANDPEGSMLATSEWARLGPALLETGRFSSTAVGDSLFTLFPDLEAALWFDPATGKAEGVSQKPGWVFIRTLVEGGWQRNPLGERFKVPWQPEAVLLFGFGLADSEADGWAEALARLDRGPDLAEHVTTGIRRWPGLEPRNTAVWLLVHDKKDNHAIK